MIRRLCCWPCCSNFRLPDSKYCEKHREAGEAREEAWKRSRNEKRKDSFEKAKRANSTMYHTAQWRHLRAEAIADHPFCSRCGNKDNLQAHHRIPPRGDASLFYNRNNIEIICADCHRRITAQEIAARRRR